MVLESTMVCVDNSDYMRNGDFLPTRLQAQQEAVTMICHSKTRANPENNVGLLTLANNIEVLATLTTDVGRIMSKLHQVQPKGEINFVSGVRIAHLALRHRQGRNHKLRIVVFVGSPIITDERDLSKLAKRLKKEKVGIDVINFGEDTVNTDKLTYFVNAVNGKEGGPSHLITIPPGPHLADALVSSPVIQGEDGSGAIGISGAGSFDFVDPNEDPELALALRVSMEEQRQRQEEEARRAAVQSSAESKVPAPGAKTETEGSNEESLLEKALAMSMETDAPVVANDPDFAAMTEEEQIAYAMQMSLQQSQGKEAAGSAEPTPMETDEADEKRGDNDDYSEVMNDPAFLQSVLETLPGVDPQSEAVRNAMGTLTQQPDDKEKEKDKKGDKGTKK
uniref:26S proteasome non-ATPase regulatory subunit 4 n=1 Tax=Strigamia maritima TaxID=126957 RepID=T1ISP0_STRMM